MTKLFNVETGEFEGSDSKYFPVVAIANPGGDVNQFAVDVYMQDAFGMAKVVVDKSLFMANWKLSVSPRIWSEYEYDITDPDNPDITPKILHEFASSSGGLLELTGDSLTDIGTLFRSRRFIKPQVNNGQVYSCDILCPDKNLLGARTWGMFSKTNGLYFKLTGTGTGWSMHVIRMKDGALADNIDVTPYLPEGFDPSKAHSYDIKFRSRTATTIQFYVDFEVVYKIATANIIDGAAMNDFSLPVSFTVTPGEDASGMKLLAGAVNVMSEGGAEPQSLLNSVQTGIDKLSLGTTGQDTALLALRVPQEVDYDGGTAINTTNIIADKLVTSSTKESITNVWHFREDFAPNLKALDWDGIIDCTAESAIGGASSDLNTAFLADEAFGRVMISEWADIDAKNTIVNTSRTGNLNFVPGDIIVIAVYRNSAQSTASQASLYFSEEL